MDEYVRFKPLISVVAHASSYMSPLDKSYMCFGRFVTYFTPVSLLFHTTYIPSSDIKLYIVYRKTNARLGTYFVG